MLLDIANTLIVKFTCCTHVYQKCVDIETVSAERIAAMGIKLAAHSIEHLGFLRYNYTETGNVVLTDSRVLMVDCGRKPTGSCAD